ncbi:MAG: PE family protein [Mycobacterium sp.]
MSFVVAEPELVQAAAQNLANLRDTLAEASASAAAPTTGVVAAAEDEVSALVAQVFGSFGQEYQMLSAQAQIFHAQFVNLLNAGAGAYLSTEVANAEQSLVNAVDGPIRGLFGQSLGGAASSGSGGVAGGFASELTAAAGLPGLGGGLLDQILGGGTGVGVNLPVSLGNGTSITSLVGSLGGGSIAQSLNGVVTGLENGAFSLLPGQLGAGLPTLQSLEALLAPGLLQTSASAGLATIAGPYQTLYTNTVQNLQAFDALWSANPAPFLHQFISNQIAYEQLVASSLQHAASDFVTGVAALPSAFQAAFQSLMAGDVTGALTDIGKGLSNLFITGLEFNPNGTVTVLGPVGDLLPIAAIPGEVSTNFNNVVNALSNVNITFSILPPGFAAGLPLALAVDAIGAPVNTLAAFGTSANAFIGAVQTGDGLGAAAALIDAPAVIANGFLNGQETLTLTLPTSLSPLPFTSSLTATIPLGGLLVPLQPVTGSAVVLGVPFPPQTLPGTEFGGFLPGLYSASEQLATAITPV